MIKYLFFIITLFFTLGSLLAQNAEEKWSVEGAIVNATTKDPVSAKIVYESLPYGSNIGILEGESFSFFIPKEMEYQIRIEAEGYSPYTHNISLHEFQEGHFYRVIELMPNGVNQLIRLEKLIFALGKAKITKESYKELDIILEMLNENPDMIIQLEGHTDYRGNEKANMKLSEARVESVQKYLIGRGVDKKRIKTKAFGGSQPLSRNDDPDSREKNRRVEVRILSN
ncbi:MAG: OmpA family protein [Candidatus Cyclobacteriaceae bacterium M2_1C_046]